MLNIFVESWHLRRRYYVSLVSIGARESASLLEEFNGASLISLFAVSSPASRPSAASYAAFAVSLKTLKHSLLAVT